MSTNKKVFILGAGMGGLTAAHELLERGYEVVMYEKQAAAGGKAKSQTYAGTGGGNPARDLPAEHGFRFFPGFYAHVTDTMSRIKRANGTRVSDSLVAATEIALAIPGQAPLILPADMSVPGDLDEWAKALKTILDALAVPTGVPNAEMLFFLKKLLCFMVSGKKRRERVYDNRCWLDFIEAAVKSPAYKALFANGLTRSLVAMQPEVGSTLTVGTILVQVLLNMFDTAQHADRVLDGPTSEVWIDPWIAHLQATGGANFSILTRHEVTGFVYDSVARRITGVQVTDLATGVAQTVGTNADRYIVALPIEVIQKLLTIDTQGIKAAAGLNRPSGFETAPRPLRGISGSSSTIPAV
jgi:uncharacterized protein with NAD-binding domain and iron-sulfur cluster